jgi:hypothetical protein
VQEEVLRQEFEDVHAGLSYRASGGLLAGVPGGQAGGLVHYALYEPGGVLLTEKLLFQIYFTVVTFLTIFSRRGHVEDGSRGGCPWKCVGAHLTLQIYHGRSVNAHLTLIGRARRSIGRIRRAARPIDNPACMCRSG